MRQALTYICILAAAWLLLEGCAPKEKTNWSVSLDHEQKAPYGTDLAYRMLPGYFPHAQVENVSRSFRYTSMDDNMLFHQDNNPALMVLLGLDLYITDEEWVKLKEFVYEGNELFILSGTLDNKITSALKCIKYQAQEEVALDESNDGSSNKDALRLYPDSLKTYGFTGRSLQGAFITDSSLAVAAAALPATTEEEETEDNTGGEVSEYIITAPPVILGKGKTHPNFIRYKYGNGHITLHAAPLVLSNYFLLQEHNRDYVTGLWHSFPANITHIYWNEYYKRSVAASDMNVLWKYPATRWALILAITTLIIYVLLGLKRKQRIVPVLKPVQNASVSFVETVGRLYYNKGNHANLAEKMIQHFLEWVRSYYYLDTSMLNETFIKQLVSKSGKDEQTVRELIGQIHDIRLNTLTVTPPVLYELHRTIQSFYDVKN